MSYLRNAWYMAAWADEVQPEIIFHRMLLDEPIAFFRRADGQVAALRDRCPHRFVPLHLGRIVGDAIQCAYHGLEFDCSGACTRNPHGNIPKAARVRAYTVIERHGVVWIWMGNGVDATPDTIPDFTFMHAVTPSAASRGYLWTESSYKLVADNVMDLSHADFLHSDSVGGGAFTRSKPTVKEAGVGLCITWENTNEKALPAYDKYLPQPGQAVDFRTQVHWSAPAIMKLDIAITPTGRPYEEGLLTHNAHIVTPETAGTSHYFFWLTRQFHMDDEEVNARRQAIMFNAFNNEDKPMLREQQLAMGTDDLFSLNPILLSTDAGAVRARRKLDQLISEEQTPGLGPRQLDRKASTRLGQ